MPQRQQIVGESSVGMARHSGQSRSSQQTGSPPPLSAIRSSPGQVQLCANFSTIRDFVPGPLTTETRNGSRARTPTPNVE